MVFCIRVTAVVADVGSRTGLLSRVFLDAGHPVVGVEPNAAMRAAAEADLAVYPGFTSVEGRAEASTLADGSVQLVIAGQAFHWFEPAAAALEFRRIAASPGWAAMVWNDRPAGGSPFISAFEHSGWN